MANANIPNINPSSSIISCIGQQIKLSTDSIGKFYLWSNGETTRQITVNKTNLYSLKIGNSLNCMSNSSKSISVQFDSVPPKPIITLNGATFMSSSDNYNQWYFNSSLITGANKKNLNPSATGYYNVEVTNANKSCKSISDSYYFELSSVEKLENNSLFIYPNPIDFYLNINSNIGIKNIQIVDMSGRILLSSNPFATTLKLDFTNFSKGTYILRIINTKNELYNKLIIKN
jgi:hypothetical protein